MADVKYCDECENFIPPDERFSGELKFARCKVFPMKFKDDPAYLLSKDLDPRNQPVEYYFCHVARGTEAMCGKEGKYFVALPMCEGGE